MWRSMILVRTSATPTMIARNTTTYSLARAALESVNVRVRVVRVGRPAHSLSSHVSRNGKRLSRILSFLSLSLLASLLVSESSHLVRSSHQMSLLLLLRLCRVVLSGNGVTKTEMEWVYFPSSLYLYATSVWRVFLGCKCARVFYGWPHLSLSLSRRIFVLLFPGKRKRKTAAMAIFWHRPSFRWDEETNFSPSKSSAWLYAAIYFLLSWKLGRTMWRGQWTLDPCFCLFFVLG